MNDLWHFSVLTRHLASRISNSDGYLTCGKYFRYCMHRTLWSNSYATDKAGIVECFSFSYFDYMTLYSTVSGMYFMENFLMWLHLVSHGMLMGRCLITYCCILDAESHLKYFMSKWWECVSKVPVWAGI